MLCSKRTFLPSRWASGLDPRNCVRKLRDISGLGLRACSIAVVCEVWHSILTWGDTPRACPAEGWQARKVLPLATSQMCDYPNKRKRDDDEAFAEPVRE